MLSWLESLRLTDIRPNLLKVIFSFSIPVSYKHVLKMKHAFLTIQKLA